MGPQIYLTDKQVAARYGVRRETVWRWAERGDFPKPIKVTPNVTRWALADVEAHEAEKAREAAA